jgi:opacity protein-like surface antigen
MKRVFAAILAFSLSSGAFAQELRVLGGVDWGRLETPFVRIEESRVLHSKPGFLVGLGLELPLRPILSVDFGLLYFEKGAKADVYYLGTLFGFDTYYLDALSLLTCLKLKPFPKLPTYLIAGGEMSYVLRYRRDFASATGGIFITHLTRLIRRFDFGLVMGGGAEIPVSQRWAILTEVRYHMGLADLDKTTTVPLKTRALALQAGIRYSLSSRKT